MKTQFPRRTEAHNLAKASEQFFTRHLPKNWVSERPSTDYGIDLRVDIFEDQAATGLELLVQLKASAKSEGRDVESVRLRTATYNYLRDKLQVVILVKYIASEDEGYWIILSKLPVPNQENESFTVHIPRDNKLSRIDWRQIQNHVRDVTDQKLAARRRTEIENR